MTDDEFDRQIGRLEALCDAAEIVTLESMFLTSPDGHNQPCPMPGETHPAYAGNAPFIRDWLNGKLPSADQHVLRLPIPPSRVMFAAHEATHPTAADLPRAATMTRKRCAGSAPYVGKPFIYRWDVAVDEYGRDVAADSRIEYIGPRP